MISPMEKFIGWPNIWRTSQFSQDWIEKILIPQAREMRKAFKEGTDRTLDCRRMAILFDKESWRTRMSFRMAMTYQGGTVSFESIGTGAFSGDMGAESIEHMIQVAAAYRPDIIVLRSEEKGSMERAIAVSAGVPIISATDSEQHPTTSLGDLFTIQEKLGTLRGLSVGIMGDLNVIVVRSLIYFLGKFGARFYFISAPHCRIGDDIRKHLAKYETPFEETCDIRTVANKLDVLYVTTSAKIVQPQLASDKFFVQVNKEVMDALKKSALVLHPLPINSVAKEIVPEVEKDPRVLCLSDQLTDTCLVRMALLRMIVINKWFER